MDLRWPKERWKLRLKLRVIDSLRVRVKLTPSCSAIHLRLAIPTVIPMSWD